MAAFLSEGSIDISVLTFHGFSYEGRTLLARQVEVERDFHAPSRKAGKSAAEKREELRARLAEKGLTGLFDEVSTTLPDARPKWGSYGINFRLPTATGRRRMCHLWVAEKGVSVVWYAESNYSEETRDRLRIEADRCGWRPVDHDKNHALLIDDNEHWQEQREALVSFLEQAQAAWNEPDDPLAEE